MEEIFEIILEVVLEIIGDAVDSKRCAKYVKVILVCIGIAVLAGVVAFLVVMAVRRNESEPVMLAAAYIVIVGIWVICEVKKHKKK
ncbi:MAG: hypothetical protein ACI4Q5_09840 [Porcipelethomonas sp.]